ncbi:NAD-dependent succinate-semialdehyde dehydrogenase [Ensifer aridi]|uniref:NAD-dependent succinate-semialdehyde dehydrogenase n=1 Tax=Ensifer aridi TaxID=1708715 RepID=UPI000A11149E|nr:NAD-dependent succinate-semialdehyde dehydrogenase [Ensifer aridi]
MIKSINPADGTPIASYDLHDDGYVERSLAAAAAAQKQWGKKPVEERVGLLVGMAKALRAGKARYAEMITREMGKPIAEAEAEIEKCAYNCDFYAEHAPKFLADEAVPSNATESVVAFDPLGVVLAIMPWNYPFWQFFRFAAPAFAAGNGAILKHANNVPACALAIEDIMREAGCPEGLFATLLIEPSKVAAIIEDDRIAAVTLTGSTEVGAIVAGQSGKALKKQVLELGGSDPFIVLADADIEEAAKVAVKARYINVGQSCVNAKRFIVEDSVADRFVELFCAGAAALRVGDPMERDTHIGPMARRNLLDTLHDQVERTVASGATLRAGGRPLDRQGFYYPPTVLDHVTPEMAAFREETFGPVAAVIRARDAEHAIALANDTEFGLGSALWTGDVERGRRLAREIEAGAVFINGMTASDPRYPFGGIKRSGYGRELGVYGIREFVNIKTIWIGPATTVQPTSKAPE